MLDRLDGVLSHTFMVRGNDRVLLAGLRSYLAEAPESELIKLQAHVGPLKGESDESA